ncbi:MAG: TIM barrel protein [Elusimicrobia bacterium]|nr:TIM barrel protein [Elusimicrobiota bacterium]
MIPAIKIAAAPCSWGVLEFDLEGKNPPYAQVLDEMSEAGYAGTELGDWGFLPTDPAKLSRELNARNLEIMAAFVPVAFAEPGAHEAGLTNALKTARLLSAANASSVIVLADDNGKNPTRTTMAGRIAPEQGLNKKQWEIFAAGVEKTARAVLKETGLKTVFHHHCGGFVETPAETQMLLDSTDPGLVGLCLDTGHWTYGGGDPSAALKKYGQRIRHVHFKDCDPKVAEQARAGHWDYFQTIKNGLFCELGQGTVPFREIIQGLQHLSYPGWIVVEQDVFPGLGNPGESASRNRAYLHKIGI